MSENINTSDDQMVVGDSVFAIRRERAFPEAKEGEKPDLIAVHTPSSPVVEQYKTLFTKIDHECQRLGKKVIAVTSALHGEGKTVTVSNLAVVAARNFGRKCLLIDAHFKRPNVANLFRLGRGLGLIDVMMQRRSLEDVLTPSSFENLTLLPMGHFLGKRAEILNVNGLKDVLTKIRGDYYNIMWNEDSDDFLQMEQHESDLFDYVFIDSPPVPAPEMAMIAEAADLLLLIVRSEFVPKEIVQQAAKRLNPAKLIGAVLNFAPVPANSQIFGYGYSGV